MNKQSTRVAGKDERHTSHCQEKESTHLGCITSCSHHLHVREDHERLDSGR